MKQKTSKVLKQSGVVPYRVKDGTTEVLLITSRNSQRWVVPKGGIVNRMSPHDSAAKEAWEEAGVIGQVNPNKFGSYKYRKNGNIYCVQMYSLPVEVVAQEFPEAGHRMRKWVDINQAVGLVLQPSLKRILKQFVKQELETDRI